LAHYDDSAALDAENEREATELPPRPPPQLLTVEALVQVLDGIRGQRTARPGLL